MNIRTVALVAAVALLGAGLWMSIRQLWSTPPPAAVTETARAQVQIEPYTIITQDMLRSEPMDRDEAYAQGAYPVTAVPGLMSTGLLLPGALVTGVNAKPIEEVRFAADLGLEIVTFQAQVDRAVGGQIRPGHLINVYGNGRDSETRLDYTELVQPYVTVVKVSASGRGYTNATPRSDPETGAYSVEGGDRDQAVNLITVAVPPDQAVNLIDAFGARRLEPWVTLAANRQAGLALATPVQAARAVPTPDFLATLQAIPMAPTAMATLGTNGYGGAAGGR